MRPSVWRAVPGFLGEQAFRVIICAQRLARMARCLDWMEEEGVEQLAGLLDGVSPEASVGK